MRLALTLLLLLLVSCAESPSRPTTSGGSSSGSGKVVTTTPEEPYECDSDLILEPHLPEECIPPEPPEPVKPAEPPEPDPIVGVYRCYSTKNKSEGLMRLYANGEVDAISMGHMERWQRDGNAYHFYGDDYTVDLTTNKVRYLHGVKKWSTKYSSDDGEPNLTAYNYDQENPYKAVECLKKSDDPDYLFEAYQLTGTNDRSGGMWACNNVGRKGTLDIDIWSRFFPQAGWADSLAECEALCAEKIRGRNTGFTCPQDRRVSQQDFVGTYVIERSVMAGWDGVLRVERDGTATIIGRGNYTWSVTNGEARFHWGFSRSPTFEKGDLAFSIGIRGSGNEREFRQTYGSGWEEFAPIKESDNPNHQFDFYDLRHGKERPNQGGTIESWCSNIGREEISGFPWGWSKGAPPTTSRDILGCLDSCVELRGFYAQGKRESATKMYCP